MKDLAALSAARDWARNHRGYQTPDDRLLRVYGKALVELLAEDLRRLADESVSATQAMIYDDAADRISHFLD